jgi:hypothetical protein
MDHHKISLLNEIYLSGLYTYKGELHHKDAKSPIFRALYIVGE